MSEKMTCPGCNSHTSGVLFAVREGRRCPYCGLSPAAILEVNAIQLSKADQDLKDRAEKAIVAEAKLESELAWCKSQLNKIRSVMDQKYEPEEQW